MKRDLIGVDDRAQAAPRMHQDRRCVGQGARACDAFEKRDEGVRNEEARPAIRAFRRFEILPADETDRRAGLDPGVAQNIAEARPHGSVLSHEAHGLRERHLDAR